MKRTDAAEVCWPEGRDYLDAGDVGTYEHHFSGPDTTEVVGVIVLARQLSGFVPVLVQPHDGGDFYLVVDAHRVVPLTINRRGRS